MPEEQSVTPKPLCPHCKKEIEDYAVNLRMGPVPNAGLIQTVMLSCVHCRCLLAGAVTMFIPTKTLAEATQALINENTRGGMMKEGKPS